MDDDGPTREAGRWHLPAWSRPPGGIQVFFYQDDPLAD